MAFVNEKLTAEQRREFMSRGIKKPISNSIANPIYRTIDTDRNMCLWHLGNLGRDDFDHHMFLFDWNGEENTIIMKYIDPDSSCDYIIWKVSEYEKKDIRHKAFINDFIDALEIYEIDGDPEQQGFTIVKVEIGEEKKNDVE